MDWTDEHYVKLYTRKTATRLLWPWQGRALHPLLMCEVDKAGTLDVGSRDPVRTVAVMVGMPEEVVKVGLDALLEDGTAELVGGRLVLPRFLEAQEARKTHAASARHHREKVRDLARAKPPKELERPVMARDGAVSRVTDGDPPSPALPVPDPVPKSLPAQEAAPPKPPPKAKDPPDPRHHPTKIKLLEVFGQERGEPLTWDSEAGGALKALFKKAGPDPNAGDVVVARWRRCLRSRYPTYGSLWDLKKNWDKFAADLATGPPSKANAPMAPGAFGSTGEVRAIVVEEF